MRRPTTPQPPSSPARPLVGAPPPEDRAAQLTRRFTRPSPSWHTPQPNVEDEMDLSRSRRTSDMSVLFDDDERPAQLNPFDLALEARFSRRRQSGRGLQANERTNQETF